MSLTSVSAPAPSGAGNSLASNSGSQRRDGGSRVLWIDLIKAVSVLLVVNLHFVLTMLSVTGSDVTGKWHWFIMFLEPLRMPIFFVVSGMMAAGAIHRSWDANRRRTLGTTHLYVTWSLILVATLFATSLTVPSVGAVLARAASMIVFPSDGFWYLLALVAFFVLAKLTVRVPGWLVVAVAAVPVLLRPETTAFVRESIGVVHDPGMLVALPLNAVFFLIGARYRDLLARGAGRSHWSLVLVTGAVASWMSIIRINNPDQWADSYFLDSLAWIATGILLAALIARSPGTHRVAGYIGSHTLPIFVLQFPVLVMVRAWLDTGLPGFLTTGAGQALYPIVATILLAAAAIALHSWALSSWARPLFVAPDAVVRATLPGPRHIGTPDPVLLPSALDPEPAPLLAKA